MRTEKAILPNAVAAARIPRVVSGEHQPIAVPDRQVDRFGEPVADPITDHDAVHHGFDLVRLMFDQGGRVFHVHHLAVDPGAKESGLADRCQDVAVLSLLPEGHGRQDHHPRTLGQRKQVLDDLFRRLLADRLPATVATRLAQPGEEQAEIIVNLGHRGDGAPRVVVSRPPVDANRGLQSLDQVHVRPFHLMEELPGVYRKTFDVLPLPLGIEGVQCQGTLAGTARPGNDH